MINYTSAVIHNPKDRDWMTDSIKKKYTEAKQKGGKSWDAFKKKAIAHAEKLKEKAKEGQESLVDKISNVGKGAEMGMAVAATFSTADAFVPSGQSALKPFVASSPAKVTAGVG